MNHLQISGALAEGRETSHLTTATDPVESSSQANGTNGAGPLPAAPEPLDDLAGVLLTGAVAPGNGRAGDFQVTVRSNSYAAASAAQATGLAGSRSVAAAVKFSAPCPENRENGPAAQRAAGAVTAAELALARRRLNAVETFRALKAAGASNKKAARAAGFPHGTLYTWGRAFAGGGFDALVPRGKNSGRKRSLQLTGAETAAIRANKLLNNQTRDTGSTVLAILKTIGEGKLRPEIAAEFQSRLQAGAPVCTAALADDLHIPAVIARNFRNPRETWLGFNSSPGSLMMTRDEITGEQRLIQPGECCTIDDGTKNFICTVPMERPGDKCWEKFRVVVGRWQILLSVDHRSYFITGISHTARPKGSYRAEDLLAALHIAFKQHGRPKKIFLEKGISASGLLHHALDLAGVKYRHVASPHQKVVEFVFNALWSRLSFLPGQVGRTRGEEADVTALAESCKRGATDPRDYFLPLAVVLSELKKVCEEWNAHLVQSRQYGDWVPRDFFAAEAPRHLRELHPAEEWIFSPTVASNNGEGYLVRAQNIRTSFLVMPGYSWVFDFEAPWFAEYFGARVRLHYNAFEPECPAMVVLQKDFHGERAGTVLGPAEQLNWHTRHSRRLFGIEETEDIGLIRTRMNAQALRRNTFAIRPDGKPGVASHVARDGAGNSSKVETFNSQHSTPNAELTAPPLQRDRRASAREVTERILARPVYEPPETVDVNGWL